MSSIRSATIRLASSMPKGSAERKALLEVLEASSGEQTGTPKVAWGLGPVTAQEIVEEFFSSNKAWDLQKAFSAAGLDGKLVPIIRDKIMEGVSINAKTGKALAAMRNLHYDMLGRKTPPSTATLQAVAQLLGISV
jgi:hypothetical protein